MARVFIIGAAGKVGRFLVQGLAHGGHDAVALHRSPAQGEELRTLGATPVFGDLLALDPPGLAALMAGCETVVFTAGAGGKGGHEMTNAIDGRGLELAAAAAGQAAVRRFLLVSAFPEAARAKPMSDTFENYMAVKKLADVHLAGTALDWVILRPGRLTDEPGTGMVRAGLAIPHGEVPRADVAASLLELVERPAVNRVIIELTRGDMPVGSAIERMARRD